MGSRKKPRLSRLVDNENDDERPKKALPPGFEFVPSLPPSTAEQLPFDKACCKVFDSTTASNIPGIFFGHFDEAIIPILSKVKTKVTKGAVKLTEGHLFYDNCDEAVGMHHIFDNKKIEKKDKVNDKDKLECALLEMLSSRGFDPTDRDFHPVILKTDETAGGGNDPECPPPDPQAPHTDWKDPRSFDLRPIKDLPLGCLFPVTEQGCWLQVWPPNGGRGLIIRLELGEVIFIHPHTVHGGCLGIGCPRVHAYVVKDPSEAEHYTQYCNLATGNVYRTSGWTQAIRPTKPESSRPAKKGRSCYLCNTYGKNYHDSNIDQAQTCPGCYNRKRCLHFHADGTPK